jgi:hypothetical protein
MIIFILIVAMPETKDELKRLYQSSGKPPNERVVSMQRETLSLLGFGPDFGVSCLNRVGSDFPADRELQTKMQYFAACAQIACQ